MDLICLIENADMFLHLCRRLLLCNRWSSPLLQSCSPQSVFLDHLFPHMLSELRDWSTDQDFSFFSPSAALNCPALPLPHSSFHQVILADTVG
jgi:hypothetical protein